MPIPLEDQFQDVIGKARRGLRLSEAQLAQKAGISLEQLEGIQGGKFDADVAAKLAGELELDAGALAELGQDAWHPGEVAQPATMAAFNTEFGDMTVNAYLVWDRDGGRAIAFDTGADVTGMLDAIAAHQLTVDAIFLTHTHSDHVADLDRLVAETGAPVYVSGLEKVARTTPIGPAETWTFGGLTVTSRLTPGHSPGGTTYVVEGLTPAVAVVGDALFASSMGGVPPEGYAAALEANRAKILALPGSTVICPGHGPLTTVALENQHNPFYA